MHSEDHVVGATLPGRPTREDGRDDTADPAFDQVTDPIRALITRLDAAAASGGPVMLDGREPIRARAIPGGFALERRT